MGAAGRSGCPEVRHARVAEACHFSHARHRSVTFGWFAGTCRDLLPYTESQTRHVRR
jgi:hypothetical protein